MVGTGPALSAASERAPAGRTIGGSHPLRDREGAVITDDSPARRVSVPADDDDAAIEIRRCCANSGAATRRSPTGCYGAGRQPAIAHCGRHGQSHDSQRRGLRSARVQHDGAGDRQLSPRHLGNAMEITDEGGALAQKTHYGCFCLFRGRCGRDWIGTYSKRLDGLLRSGLQRQMGIYRGLRC